MTLLNHFHPRTVNRGRPRGVQRERFANFVSANGQFTLRDVARSLGVAVREADQVVRRAADAGEIKPIGTTRHAAAKRPVLVYEPTSGRAVTMSGAAALAQQLRCWS